MNPLIKRLLQAQDLRQGPHLSPLGHWLFILSALVLMALQLRSRSSIANDFFFSLLALQFLIMGVAGLVQHHHPRIQRSLQLLYNILWPIILISSLAYLIIYIFF